jgi:hypothetical protein
MTGRGRLLKVGLLTIDLEQVSRWQRVQLYAVKAVLVSLGVFGFGTFTLSRLGGGFALDIVTGRAAGPGARTMYLALYSTAPNDASTMASIAPGVEVSMTGYARQICAFTAPTSATPPETHNTSVITFGPLTGSMVTVTSFAIVSTSSGASGDLVAFGNLTASRLPVAGDSLQAAIAAFSLTDE